MPVSFTLRNGDSKPCNAAFAFFAQGAPQARAAGGGAALAYQVLSPSGGSATQVAPASPASLSGGNAAFITVGARQTVPVTATISVGQGQVVGAGVYTDQLFLGIYQSPGGGTYAKAAPETPLNVTIGVNSQMTLAVAGGGLKTTLNFGDLVEGAKRSVQLLAYSNQPFHLAVSSDNAGVMKPVDSVALSEGQWRVPYTISVFRTGPIDLSQQRTLSLWPAATQRSGLAIPIDVQIGSTKGQRAGIYRDVITIAIDAGP